LALAVGQIWFVLTVMVMVSDAVAPAGVIVTPEIWAIALNGKSKIHHRKIRLSIKFGIIWLWFSFMH
jgi:hypothetical protein